MLCEKCGKNPATVMYTQIINGHKESINICSSCASKESIFDNFGTLLSFSPSHTYSALTCPVCSTSLSEFTRSGRAGCGQCYTTFRKYADAMLKKIHGTSTHFTGNEQVQKPKEPQNAPLNELDKLKAALSDAIEKENFEEAAALRDKIRSMEKEGK